MVTVPRESERFARLIIPTQIIQGDRAVEVSLNVRRVQRESAIELFERRLGLTCQTQRQAE